MLVHNPCYLSLPFGVSPWVILNNGLQFLNDELLNGHMIRFFTDIAFESFCVFVEFLKELLNDVWDGLSVSDLQIELELFVVEANPTKHLLLSPVFTLVEFLEDIVFFHLWLLGVAWFNCCGRMGGVRLLDDRAWSPEGFEHLLRIRWFHIAHKR